MSLHQPDFDVAVEKNETETVLSGGLACFARSCGQISNGHISETV